MYKVEKESENIFPLGNLDNNCIVGILWKSDNSKAIVRHSSDGFCATSIDTVGIEMLAYHEPSIKKYVERATSSDSGVAYVFDSYEDLFNWLKN